MSEKELEAYDWIDWITCPRCEGQKYDRGSCGLCGNLGFLCPACAARMTRTPIYSGGRSVYRCTECDALVVVERSEREQILEAFYDSITGILFLHDEGRMGHTSVLGEVRHSTRRCEEQLGEIEDAEVRALSEEDDHAVA